MTINSSSIPGNGIPASLKTSYSFSDAYNWLAEGWALFKTAPVKLFLFCLLPMIISGCIQLIPSPAGMILSKWAGAIVVASVWPVLSYLHHHSAFSVKSVFVAKNWLSVAVYSVTGVIVAAQQFGVAYALAGDDAVAMFFQMSGTGIKVWQLSLIFASAVPLMTLLIFAPARIFFAYQNPLRAVQDSISAVVKMWKPCCVIAIIQGLLLALAPYTILLSVVLSGPVLACTWYCVYQRYISEQ